MLYSWNLLLHHKLQMYLTLSVFNVCIFFLKKKRRHDNAFKWRTWGIVFYVKKIYIAVYSFLYTNVVFINVRNGGYRKYMLPVCPLQRVFSSVWSQRSVTAACCWKTVPYCFLVCQTLGIVEYGNNKVSLVRKKMTKWYRLYTFLEIGFKC